jgi:hypothetical protein
MAKLKILGPSTFWLREQAPRLLICMVPLEELDMETMVKQLEAYLKHVYSSK